MSSKRNISRTVFKTYRYIVYAENLPNQNEWACTVAAASDFILQYYYHTTDTSNYYYYYYNSLPRLVNTIHQYFTRTRRQHIIYIRVLIIPCDCIIRYMILGNYIIIYNCIAEQYYFIISFFLSVIQYYYTQAL